MHMSRRINLENLKAFIAAGDFAPGERLPAERELIDALGMTRTKLRHALDSLEQEGVIWRHVGKGTFLTEETEETAEQSETSLESIVRQLTPVKVMRARLSIEPAIAREAAINASGDAVARIMEAIKGSEAARSWVEYEAFDDEFHHAIAAASDNMLLLALYDKLNKVQRTLTWRKVVRENSLPPPSHTSFAEHRKIAETIKVRDPDGAHSAMRRHIGSVSARLFGEI